MTVVADKQCMSSEIPQEKTFQEPQRSLCLNSSESSTPLYYE